MEFSNNFSDIDCRLRLTGEMLEIVNSPEKLPLSNLHDVTGALKRCKVEGASVTLDELLLIRRSLQTISDVNAFFSRTDNSEEEEESHSYPYLREMCGSLTVFPG